VKLKHGEPVTGDIFSEHRLTMIFIWATWCDASELGMPEVGKLLNMMPEGTQVIGFIDDVFSYDLEDEEVEKAKSILDSANANFPQIVFTWGESEQNNDGIFDFLAGSGSYPRAIFVDSNKQIIGEIVNGTRTAGEYLAIIRGLLGEKDEASNGAYSGGSSSSTGRGGYDATAPFALVLLPLLRKFNRQK
jgi:hypothetical protein